MGSDAPVAPLDPWLAISAAVFGTESSDREPFSLSNVLISKPLSLRPPPWGVRRCKLEMRQT